MSPCLLAASRALAGMIPEEKIPRPDDPPEMDWHISPVVAGGAARAAQESGVAQLGPEKMAPEKVHERTEALYLEGELAWLPQEGHRLWQDEHQRRGPGADQRYQGVIQVYTKVPIKDEIIYRQLYAPEAVAEVSRNPRHPMAAYGYTSKNDLVAIVTDGSAVLGLGDIGPPGGLAGDGGKGGPVEDLWGWSPSHLYRHPGDRFVVRLVEAIAPTLAASTWRHLSSPRCFEMSER